MGKLCWGSEILLEMIGEFGWQQPLGHPLPEAPGLGVFGGSEQLGLALVQSVVWPAEVGSRSLSGVGLFRFLSEGFPPIR